MLRSLIDSLTKKPRGMINDRVSSVTIPLSTLVRIVRARIKRDRAKKVYLLAHRQKVAVSVLQAYNEWRRLENEYCKLKRRLI